MLETVKTQKTNQSRTRDPRGTRDCLIRCAFQEIYEQGYAGASLDRILANSGVTKGALYHHFGSKADLAHAVIDDVIRPMVLDVWTGALHDTDDPITTLSETCLEVMGSHSPAEICCGCPLNNLAQEMSNTDEAFRTHVQSVYDDWRSAVREAFERGKGAGTVRADVDTAGVAVFVVGAIAGFATTAKSTRDRDLTMSGGGVFLQFLESLRPHFTDSPTA